MTKEIKNYSEAQEARIREEAAKAPLNKVTAEMLGAEFGKSGKSVTAKALRMGVPYAKQKPVSKTGAPVVRKENLVIAIGNYVPGSLEGLDKASKPALENILAAFEALDV